MTRNELIFRLRSLEIQLLSPQMDAFIEKQDATVRERFVRLSVDLRVVILKLTTAQLASIADRLEDLSEELEAGIARLRAEIDSLNKAIKVIETLSEVVGFAARVVGLAL